MHRFEEEMDEFEQSLQRALRRVEPSAETTGKLLALAAESEDVRAKAGGGPRLLKMHNAGRVVTFPRARGWWAGAAAAALAAGVFAGVQVHREHERARAEQQFAVAMQVKDHAFEHARQQLERAGVVLGQ